MNGRGALFLGASGSGKSTLALELMAKGAELVADDIVCLRIEDDKIFMAAPPKGSGLIEARGLGVFQLPSVDFAPLHLVIDLDREPISRLPAPHGFTFDEITAPLYHGKGVAGLASVVFLALKHNRYPGDQSA